MKSKISLFFLIFFNISILAQSDLKIISSDQRSILLEFVPVYTDTSIKIIDGHSFYSFDFYNSYLPISDNPGVPIQRERRFNLGVPDENGNTIEILSTESIERTGELLPYPKMMKDGNFNISKYEKSNEYSSFKSEFELVSFGDFGLVRDLPVQTFIIRPVQFDPSINKIKIYKRILMRINFTAAVNNQPVNDDLLSFSVMNFNNAKFWVKRNTKLKKEIINSVLSTGKWVRFETPTEGIYKIDYNSLSSFGIDPSTVDPRTIKIYNNGGKVLPELNTTTRPIDLIENAIFISGESDGKFDASDYILFYGRGTSFWDFDQTANELIRQINPYSAQNFFWITSGGNNGKRMISRSSESADANLIVNNTPAFILYEDNKINLGKSGREFFGDDFTPTVNSRTYTNKLDHRDNSLPVNYKFRFINGTSVPFTLSLQENTSSIFNDIISGHDDYYKVGYSEINFADFSSALTDDRSVLKFQTTFSNSSSVGYLDYFEIEYTRFLKPVDDHLLFLSPKTDGIVEYDLSGFASTNIKVYDVSDFSNTKIITNPSMLSGGEFRFKAAENSVSNSRYFAVGNDKFLTPINPVEAANSNVHGIESGAKYIIITSKEFLDAANRLKDYRQNEAEIPISTIVVDIQEIFNEFSGGLFDPTAMRDFLKYAYDNWTIKPEYVLFFGAGTYDYKNIESFGSNFIPTYQTVESLALIYSYTTDDYFCRISGTDLVVDLGFGRITVHNSTEANNVVDKIIYYETQSEKGPWRNNITMIADDEKTSTTYEGSEHTAPSETLATTIIPQSFDIHKIYSTTYADVITGAGRRKPDVNKAIIDAINEGTLLVNYIGHGSPDVWAHEFIFEKNVTIPQLKNDKYFFMSAATCDFGYYDIPNSVSAAEEMLLMPEAGEIGAFTSSRLVYSGLNHALSYQLFRDLLLAARDSLNLNVPLGKALFETKQLYYGVNDQKYHIFGDPLLRLRVPEYPAMIDTINGSSLTTAVQIKALGDVNLSGKILDDNGNLWSDFNGEGILTVFDSERSVLLEKMSTISNPVYMKVQGGVIFKGRVSVVNGEFESSFVVPKDISYENKNGKIVFYFLNSNSDGLGYTNQIIVGGTDTTKSNDGAGPEIEIYFDDTSFRNAYLVTPNSKLIVKLSDETGLNTTGTGVGHNLEGILNDDKNNPLNLTNYFTGDLDADGKSGEINYQFSDLAQGEYKIQVKAWDVFNNFSDEITYFSVVSGDELVISDIYNYPNPFSSNTTFTFQQNLNSPIDVKIKIYTVAGRLIKQIEQNAINEKYVTIDWDGRDEDGDILANGVYLYKIIVKTINGDFNKSVLGKIAVIK